MSRSKLFPVLLIGLPVLGALALVVVSLRANKVRWDRETDLASAKYDGEALLAGLGEAPFASVGLPEMEKGPLAPDLTNHHEAWISWRQAFSAESGLPAAIAWHRERLPVSEWASREPVPDKAIFENGEWTLTLEVVPQSDPPTFRRELRWTRRLSPDR